MPRGHLLRATILQQICEWLQIGCSANINKPKIWDDLVYVNTCQYHIDPYSTINARRRCCGDVGFYWGIHTLPIAIATSFWRSSQICMIWESLQLHERHEADYENPMVQKIKKTSINCTKMSSMKPMTHGAIFEGHSPIALPSPEEHHLSAGLRS